VVVGSKQGAQRRGHLRLVGLEGAAAAASAVGGGGSGGGGVGFGGGGDGGGDGLLHGVFEALPPRAAVRHLCGLRCGAVSEAWRRGARRFEQRRLSRGEQRRRLAGGAPAHPLERLPLRDKRRLVRVRVGVRASVRVRVRLGPG